LRTPSRRCPSCTADGEGPRYSEMRSGRTRSRTARRSTCCASRAMCPALGPAAARPPRHRPLPPPGRPPQHRRPDPAHRRRAQGDRRRPGQALQPVAGPQPDALRRRGARPAGVPRAPPRARPLLRRVHAARAAEVPGLRRARRRAGRRPGPGARPPRRRGLAPGRAGLPRRRREPRLGFGPDARPRLVIASSTAGDVGPCRRGDDLWGAHAARRPRRRRRLRAGAADRGRAGQPAVELDQELYAQAGEIVAMEVLGGALDAPPRLEEMSHDPARRPDPAKIAAGPIRRGFSLGDEDGPRTVCRRRIRPGPGPRGRSVHGPPGAACGPVRGPERVRKPEASRGPAAAPRASRAAWRGSAAGESTRGGPGARPDRPEGWPLPLSLGSTGEGCPSDLEGV
jgi:hypothetical protein